MLVLYDYCKEAAEQGRHSQGCQSGRRTLLLNDTHTLPGVPENELVETSLSLVT
jgi:hypothetical protein